MIDGDGEMGVRKKVVEDYIGFTLQLIFDIESEGFKVGFKRYLSMLHVAGGP